MRLIEKTVNLGKHRLIRCLSTAIIAGSWVYAGPLNAQAEARRIQPSAFEQMRVLAEEKRSRTPTQRKISTDLLFAMREEGGESLRDEVPMLRVELARRADDLVEVDLDAEVTEAVLALITGLGGTAEAVIPRYRFIRASLPLMALDELAAATEVRAIHSSDLMITNGTTINQGDVAHGFDLARTEFGIDGSGVTTCAMSDSVEDLETLQDLGELPDVTILPGQAGVGLSEGTAILELIHDSAPGSTLMFATAMGGQAQMAQNILDLQAAGCDVISNDAQYLTEPVFQHGIIAQAIGTVSAAGTIFVTSAGNSGNLLTGNSGVFEGTYVPLDPPALLAGTYLSVQGFAVGEGSVSPSNEVTLDAPFAFTLQWANPFEAAADDYDLFLLDASLANVVAASTFVQDGDDDPVEQIASNGIDHTGLHLVIAHFNGDTPFFHLNSHRGRLEFGTNGQIFGNSAHPDSVTVGAIDVAMAGGGLFDETQLVVPEPFSSDGPRRQFFNPDGTTPEIGRGAGTAAEGGNDSGFLSKDQIDFVAANRLETESTNFPIFSGTSASQAVIAALAALARELDPDLQGAQLGRLGGFGALPPNPAVLDPTDPLVDQTFGNGIPLANILAEDAPDCRGELGSIIIDDAIVSDIERVALSLSPDEAVATFCFIVENFQVDINLDKILIELLQDQQGEIPDVVIVNAGGNGQQGSYIDLDCDPTLPDCRACFTMSTQNFRGAAMGGGNVMPTRMVLRIEGHQLDAPTGGDANEAPIGGDAKGVETNEIFISWMTVAAETSPPGAVGEFTFTGAIETTLRHGEAISLPGIGGTSEVVFQDDPSPQGFELASIACSDGGSATPSVPDLDSGSVTFQLDPFESIECSFLNGPPSLIFSDGFESGDTTAW